MVGKAQPTLTWTEFVILVNERLVELGVDPGSQIGFIELLDPRASEIVLYIDEDDHSLKIHD
jgi:hypothetical protein